MFGDQNQRLAWLENMQLQLVIVTPRVPLWCAIMSTLHIKRHINLSMKKVSHDTRGYVHSYQITKENRIEHDIIALLSLFTSLLLNQILPLEILHLHVLIIIVVVKWKIHNPCRDKFINIIVDDNLVHLLNKRKK